MVWKFDVATLLVAVGLLGIFGVLYFALTAAAGVPQAQAIVKRVLRRR